MNDQSARRWAVRNGHECPPCSSPVDGTVTCPREDVCEQEWLARTGAACPVPGAPLVVDGPSVFPDGPWPAIDWADVARKVKADVARGRRPVVVTPRPGESDGETLRRDRIANGRCRQARLGTARADATVPTLAPTGTPDRLDARAAELEATALELRTLANVLRMRALLDPADRAPRYRIERMAGEGWTRSAYYGDRTLDRREAEEICSSFPGLYRMVPTTREART